MSGRMLVAAVMAAIMATIMAACGGGAGAGPAATTGPAATSTVAATAGGDGTDDPTTDTGNDFDSSISVSDFEFNPGSFAFDSGERLGLLAQRAKAPHTFTIEALGIDEPIAPGVVATVEISGDAGTYEFICRFHAGQGMKGTVELRAP